METSVVLKIGRDFQNSDRDYRGCTFDTAKLLCDKIEELSQELEAERAKAHKHIGNASKLREALELAKDRIIETKEFYDSECNHGDLSPLLGKIENALSEPARNCDVGTLEERREQFKQFCKSHSSVVVCNRDCPLYNLHTKGYSCHFEWGELPNESGAKA